MKFLSSEKLSQHKYKTPEGYLICTDAILARTGKQTYRKCEVFADAANDESEIEIDRKAEEVFAPETLASFENKPITVEHPDENVTPDNYNSLSVGFVRDVHKGTVNGQDVMLGTLVITDAKAIEEIENGERTDLSCGYDCDITDEANPQQRNIRGNHVALCEQGRAGIARIVDSVKDDIVFDYTEADLDKAKEMLITAKTDDEKKLIKSLIAKIEFELKSKKLNDSIDRNKIEQIIKSRQFELRKNGDKIQEYIYKGNAEDKKYNFEELAKVLPTNVSLALSGDELSVAFRDSVKDSILGKHVIIRPRDVRMNKYVDERGIVHSYEGTNADDIVEVKLNNGQYVEVRYDEIRFLDASYKDAKYRVFYVNSADKSAQTVVEAASKEEAKIKAKQQLGKECYSINSIVEDSVNDAPTLTTSGRDMSKYTLQSSSDKNLFFYIGEKYAMKEGSWTYQLYNLNDMTAEELLEDLKKSGWKQIPNRKTVIDSCDIIELNAKSNVEDVQSKETSFRRLEDLPLKSRQELKNSSNKKATLLSIENNIEDIINAADEQYKQDLRVKGDKILSDLRKQFNINDCIKTFKIKSQNQDDVYIDTVKAHSIIDAIKIVKNRHNI